MSNQFVNEPPSFENNLSIMDKYKDINFRELSTEELLKLGKEIIKDVEKFEDEIDKVIEKQKEQRK